MAASLDAAEEYFKQGNIEMAIRHGFATLDINPDLPIVEKYIAAYLIHNLGTMLSLYRGRKMDETRILYAILSIQDWSTIDAAAVKKHYKEMVLMVHPDKNNSAAAEGAFKILQQAYETLLSDHNRRRIA